MNITQLKTHIIRYVSGTDFSRGLILAISIVSVVSAGYYLNMMPIGVGMAIGSFLVAPGDVPGNFRHRLLGMLSAVFLGVSVTIIGGLLNFNFWLELPIFFVVFFSVAFISVYGFRASLVTFTGLIASVLSFSSLGGDDIFLHALYIALGGLWYIILSSIYLLLRPEKHTEVLLGETASLTGKFLSIRAKLAEDVDREQYLTEQFNLQISINELHENLREALLSSRQKSGRSNSSRRQILIFIELVDILELGIAHPVNFQKVDELNKEFPELIVALKKLILEMGRRLNHISEVFIDGNRLTITNKTAQLIKEVEQLIETYKKTEEYPQSRPTVLLMRNLLDFEKKQHQKILSIERVLGNIKQRDAVNVKLKRPDQFLTPTDYSFKILAENFSLSSTIFRHSLRLAILMVLGLILGHVFDLQNSYWILLTVVVIMRPNYGLTKERTKKRIIGTLIGGVVAIGIVLLVNDPYIYIILAVISLITAFSMLQKNYVGAAAFITLNVVFLYALLQPNALNVIQYRVLDTLVGAGLAFLGNKFILPTWEHIAIENTLANVIEKNINYLKEIEQFYNKKGRLTNAYKLARKEAFLAMGNLSAAFQRTSQEPKSKQKEYSHLYRYTVLNYTFLSSLASLGSFIRSHKTTEASVYFESYIAHILENLNDTLTQLNKSPEKIKAKDKSLSDVDKYLNKQYSKLDHLRNKELEEGKEEISLPLRVQMQEAQLISEQLKWLHQVSLNLKNVNSKATYERLF
ncbi:Uncharacterized membrane protein YccC [Mesonia phycicola]|uniref:Uncharacterized membrane protein YccC n=1 Tax=Mesonia phycicola TaxID=579105 RepID=A0A1M6BNI5_9FLAO|nr:FUSC family protein [Mesonia phycicola]SHI50128.1 Uncharacterized membrane protein YccC [Mesonia phycicola]